MRFPHIRPRRDRSEAAIAREKAERDLAATRAQTPPIRVLAGVVREIRERNHLADDFVRAFTKGQS